MRDRIGLSWYIPSLLKICEKIKKNCSKCRFARPKNLTAQLGKLPAFRLNPVSDKTFVVDIVGPFHVMERPVTQQRRGVR